MGVLRSLRLAMALVTVVTASATAQSASRTTSLSVRAEIAPVRAVGIIGDGRLMLHARAIGQAPAPAVDASTRYSIATNGESSRIVAALQDAALPEGLVLEVSLAAPGTGTSVGMRALEHGRAVPVVTAIGQVRAAEVPITYQLSAAGAAGARPPDVLNVQFTIISDDVSDPRPGSAPPNGSSIGGSGAARHGAPGS